jgi:O-antigen/teichoic acid export membrane protein
VQVKDNLKNVLSLLTMEFFSRLLGFLSVTYLARVMGTGSFGYINIAQAVLTYLIIAGAGGMNLYGTRKIIAASEPAYQTTSDVFLTKLLLTGICYIIFVPVAYAVTSPELFYIILAYSLFAFPYLFLPEWFFQAHMKMDLISIGRILGMASYFILLLIFVSASSDAVFTGIAYTVGGIINTFFLLYIYIRQGNKLSFSFKEFRFIQTLKQTFSLGISSVISQVVAQFPVIFLGFISTASEAGLYSAAYKIILLILVLDRVFSALFFPKITAVFNCSREEFELMLNRIFRIVSIIGLSVLMLVIISSSTLVHVLFGNEFIESGIVLNLMAGVFFFSLLSSVFTFTLIGMNKENIYTASLITGIAVFLISVYPLTKYYGAAGAAAAYALFQAVSFIYMYFRLNKKIPVYIFRPLVLPAFISLIIIYILTVYVNYNLYLQLLLVLAGGIPAVSYSGGLNMKELKYIKRAFI